MSEVGVFNKLFNVCILAKKSWQVVSQVSSFDIVSSRLSNIASCIDVPINWCTLLLVGAT